MQDIEKLWAKIEDSKRIMAQDVQEEELKKLGEWFRRISKSVSRKSNLIRNKSWTFKSIGNCSYVWILTGCPWFELAGGCSVCDGYGKSEKLMRSGSNWRDNLQGSIDSALARVREEARLIPKSKRYVLSFGSAMTLNNASIPYFLRESLFKELNKIMFPFVKGGGGATYLLETRLTDITENGLKQIREHLHRDIAVEIGIGYEASSDLVREVLVNKGYSKNASDKMREAIELSKKYGIKIEGHVLLGIPGLTELESIASAIRTSEELFDMGVERVILATTNIKENACVASLLRKHGLFTPPSIHSTVEVIRNLNSKGYYGILPVGFDTFMPASEFAQGCEKCTSRIRGFLREYVLICLRDDPKNAAEFFRSADLDCECKARWIKRILAKEKPLLERLPSFIKSLEEVSLMEDKNRLVN